MRQKCTLLVISVVLGAAIQALAQEPETQKIWRFQGSAGTVEIKLTRYVNSDGTKPTSLHIYSLDGTPRIVTEEAGFLAKVLDDLPKARISVQSLNWISFRFNESEAVSKVAACAASSKQWKRSLKTRNISVVYPLVTSCLNASGAYEEWNGVFKQHGLTLKVAGVEEVIMEPFSQTHTNCPATADCKNLLVPKDALVQMNVSPITRR